MNTMKTLMLAGLAAVSLGIGGAMAQTSGDPNALTWTNRDLLGAPTRTFSAQPQSGSSDVDATQSYEQHFPAWVGYNLMIAGAPGG